MPLLTKDCLERLRERIDLAEIVGSHIELKKAGGKIKALCPFHNEKSPSFTVSSGDSHYHCFGCGAHGDAIAFLMHYLGISFNEAVEYLANRYGIALEYTGKSEGPFENKRELYGINALVMDFFHFHLLYSEEGKGALQYLFKRGISEEFIKEFKIGYAPKGEQFQKAFYKSERFSEENLVKVGLLSESTKRPFFSERVMFPIHDGLGNVIGFSGRKIDEGVFGGKYINTRETVFFKKSRILFGLNYSRRKIAKKGKVICVEGQIDALRLIFEGFDNVVASQGTAFGQEHVQELMKLGIKEVILCFDGDEAGIASAIKVGQIFQIEGIEVFICSFPEKMDPDSFLLEYGKDAFETFLETKAPFLNFLIKTLSDGGKADTPAGKNGVVFYVKKKISEWKHPVMIHEGEKTLARLMKVPEKYIVTSQKEGLPAVRKTEHGAIDPLECDLIRWLILLVEPFLIDIIMDTVDVQWIEDLKVARIYEIAKTLYEEGKKIDLLNVGIYLDEEGIAFLEELQKKRMNVGKAEEGVRLLCQKLIDREVNKQTDSIKKRIQQGNLSEEESFALAKEFDAIKKNRKNILKLTEKG
jgi:DNA primase